MQPVRIESDRITGGYEMKRKNVNSRNAHADREMRGTFLGIAVGAVLYLALICAMKDISFAIVAVAGVSAAVTALAVSVADRLME